MNNYFCQLATRLWDDSNIQIHQKPHTSGHKNNWAMQSKMVFQICEGICSSFYVKDFDVIDYRLRRRLLTLIWVRSSLTLCMGVYWIWRLPECLIKNCSWYLIYSIVIVGVKNRMVNILLFETKLPFASTCRSMWLHCASVTPILPMRALWYHGHH